MHHYRLVYIYKCYIHLSTAYSQRNLPYPDLHFKLKLFLPYQPLFSIVKMSQLPTSQTSTELIPNVKEDNDKQRRKEPPGEITNSQEKKVSIVLGPSKIIEKE